jgi:hypothetical protein
MSLQSPLVATAISSAFELKPLHYLNPQIIQAVRYVLQLVFFLLLRHKNIGFNSGGNYDQLLPLLQPIVKSYNNSTGYLFLLH